jgi:REP element-mobilizing transposase RayT
MTFGLLAEHILHHAARLHDVNIIAYKINPDHVHLLCQIGAEGTISTLVAAWKRQFARQTNSILKRTPQLYATNSFKWQPSYHSHLITSKNDFSAHVNYILNQYKHHDLPVNNFVYWNRNHVFRFV